jgi:hypothetical protein
MNRYVTYLPDGTLDGCYLQTVAAAHMGRMIAVDEAIAPEWVAYRANITRDGVELIPALPSQPVMPVVPQQISSGQGREALYNVGLFANVQPAIDAIEDPDTKWRVQNAWDYRPTWERQSPFVEMMAGILGLSGEEADQLFVAAAGL